MYEHLRRVVISFTAVLLVVAIGTGGYYLLGSPNWSVTDCIYMTLVTVTTLGIEVLPGFETTPYARGFTVFLLVIGIGAFLYFASSLTAAILESDLRHLWIARKMRKTIDALEDHIIVCGAGATGRHVVQEMLDVGAPFVVVETDEEHLRALRKANSGVVFPHVIGDATDDAVLISAGIRRCRGLVSSLPSDKDNLYVVITARELNPLARIVAKCVGARAADKLRKAGADEVVTTTKIGGMRLASEVLRPHVTEFLDEMLHPTDAPLRIEEVEIPANSPLVGQRLRDARIREKTDALVLAVKNRQEGTYLYNPGLDMELAPGTTLIVMARSLEMPTLRAGLASGWS